MLKIITKEKEIEKKISEIKSKEAWDNRPQELAVRRIIKAVRDKGDQALKTYTKKFDGVEIKGSLKVSRREFDAAYKKVDQTYLAALKVAIRNITNYHKKQISSEWFDMKPYDVVLGMRNIPIDRVGVYVPGGKVPYPSSVLMNVIPAKVAGVKRIVMVTPPSKKDEGGINPHILVAAKELGISSVYKVGGVQAVAALAYGTKTVPQVDKIVGPGNLYVTLAKKILYGTVGIDKLAGPSDVMIIAGKDANPRFIAADLLAQAEHDLRSSAILVTDSLKLAKAVQKVSKKEKELDKAGIILVVKDLNQAAEVANLIAPEHLELMVKSPHRYLEKIRNAGAVFLGPHSPAVVGDYLAGPNHVLPTGGSARFESALGVYDFVKKQSVVGYTQSGLEAVASNLLKMTEVENLTAHGKAIQVRIKKR